MPSVAFSRPISTLAKVDLPQPDSPTIATVSASRARKLSFSLAFTVRGLAGEEERALLDRIVLGEVVDLEHDVARLGRLAAGAFGDGASQSISSTRMQREAWKSTLSTGIIGISPASQRPATKKEQRGPKLQPGGRWCGSGSWPGMATSGREFLSAPGIGIEAKRPRV